MPDYDCTTCKDTDRCKPGYCPCRDEHIICPMAGPEGCACEDDCCTCPRADAECPICPEQEELERIIYNGYI